MAITLGINGFGRIGRLVFRAICENGLLGKAIDIKGIYHRDPKADYAAYQVAFDSAQGKSCCKFTSKKSSPDLEHDDLIVVNGKHEVPVLMAQSHPRELAWKDLGVDYVIDATGAFNKEEDARGHLEAGAKKVVLTAPGKGDGFKTMVYKINSDEYDPEKHDLVSNASCTTNCLAPVVYVLLKEGIGIEKGLMTTIHAYTSSQNTVDNRSKKNWRIGRAAAANIIPTTTGAAKAVGIVIPEVQGIMTGMAFRVPTITGSVVDLTFTAARDTSIEEIDSLMKKASETYLKDVLEYQTLPIVSSDVIGDDESSIYDSEATLNNNLPDEKRFFKIIAWYDNEWGYTKRTVDLLLHMAIADGKLTAEEAEESCACGCCDPA